VEKKKDLRSCILLFCNFSERKRETESTSWNRIIIGPQRNNSQQPQYLNFLKEKRFRTTNGKRRLQHLNALKRNEPVVINQFLIVIYEMYDR
jgi:septum formation topological specificity factor MinE